MVQTTVVGVQLNARVFDSAHEYAEAIRRFVSLAQSKEAKLVVFPECLGMLLVPALWAGFRPSLLRNAGRRRQRGASLLQKARGWVAGSVAGALKADMRNEIIHWLSDKEHLALLEKTYRDVFSSIAAEFRISIVAGSCYQLDASLAAPLHSVYVFGPDGSLLGTQAQVHLSEPRLIDVRAGEQLVPIETPAGVLGILGGSDALFPESARILAYQGADILVNPAACLGPMPAAKLRHAFEARVAENEVFGIQSFLVGVNPWAGQGQPQEFVGGSAILGPMDLIPRSRGVLTELGESMEGVLVGTLDRAELHRWWSESRSSLRRCMRPGIYSQPLARFYGAGQTVQDAWEARELVSVPPAAEAGQATEYMPLAPETIAMPAAPEPTEAEASLTLTPAWSATSEVIPLAEVESAPYTEVTAPPAGSEIPLEEEPSLEDRRESRPETEEEQRMRLWD